LGKYYDSIDFAWTGNGDLSFEEGDIADTSSDTLLSTVQEIQTVCRSSLQDWEIWPGIGAGLDDFIGEANTEETSNLIHDRLRLAIISQGIVDEEDLLITIVPTHRFEVLIIIRVDAIATPYNSLANGNLLVVQAVYDYMEKGIFFLLETPVLIES
jgi:hypothetical protein